MVLMRTTAVLVLMAALAVASLQLSASPGRRPRRAAAAANPHAPTRQGQCSNATVDTAHAQPGAISDEVHQKEFCVGASVYDRSQSGSDRGYGTITKPGNHPGTWYVEWLAGSHRVTAISETYLELALIPYAARAPPTAMGQGVLVLLGTCKGTKGTTVKRLGDKWQCRLDGAQGLRSFTDDYLHATEAAPEGAAVSQFKPVLLASGIPAAALPAWLSNYQNDPSTAMDLVQKKPDSRTWASVLMGECSVDDLSTEEVAALRYKAEPYLRGQAKAAQATGSAGGSDGSGGEAEPDVSTIRAGLQQAAQGRYTMKFGCPYEGKGCPFMLEARHSAGTASVDVWQTGGHEYHDPTSAAERGQLKMHPALLGVVTLLLRGGNKPAPVCTTVNNMVLEPGDPLGLGIGGGSLSAAHFSNGRTSITKEQVYAVKKRLRRDSGFGLTSDPQAIAAFVAELEAADSLGHYQAYKAACGTGRARQPEKPLIVVVQTPFQKRLLNEFGRRLVFLDTTFGTNRHGFPLSALLVQDEAGCYVPAGFMVHSAETVEVYELFLRTLQRGAQEVGDGTFKYGHVMIDKSKQEIAAVRQLASTGDALDWLLCYFHFLQEWERFLTSSESGVRSREERHSIMLSLARLAHFKDKAVFEEELAVFCISWRAYPTVTARMEQSWKPCAEHWAWWGRTAVLDLCANTNNGTERYFGLFKYTDCQRKAQMSVHELLVTLVTVSLPRCIQNRAHRLAGRYQSDQQQREERAQAAVEEIVERGGVVPAAGGAPGLAWVYGREGDMLATACVADLSCSCGFSDERPCIHMRAAAKHIGFTHMLRRQAAEHLAGSNQMKVDKETGLCSAPLLAAPTKAAYCRPYEGACTCHDHALHGICCHLMAAALLPGEQRMELRLSVHLAAPANDTQPIEIKGRAFQQPASEPLGDDWAEELRKLQATRAASTEVIKRTVHSDPTGLRAKVAECGRMLASLPEEEAEEARPEVESLHSKLALLAEGVTLKPTKKRAGKLQRRKDGRCDTDQTVKALDPSRRKSRKRGREAAPTAEVSDPLPTMRKKDEAAKKMRGVTVPGNVHGTVLRNGAAHHRVPKDKR